MLTRALSHIDGMSVKFEEKLREMGIDGWDDILTQMHLFTELPPSKLERIRNSIQESKQALIRNDLNFFKNVLKSKEHWRLCNLGKIAYVDIETTGLSRWSDTITVIGIYDGYHPHLYVNGKNLNEAHEKLKEFDIVVTFNGKQFDIPFIEQNFSCKYDFVHLDLRYMLKELGLQGGLKSIEWQLGINRASDLQGVDGFEAVRLWHKYQRGCEISLSKLLRYNQEDIINLKTLLNYYLDKKQKIV